MDNYEKSETPGMVLKNGIELDAVEACEELAELLHDVQMELEDTESELDLAEAQISACECEDLGDIYKQADRVRYACTNDQEKIELKALLEMLSPDSAMFVGVLGK